MHHTQGMRQTHCVCYSPKGGETDSPQDWETSFFFQPAYSRPHGLLGHCGDWSGTNAQHAMPRMGVWEESVVGKVVGRPPPQRTRF